MCLVALSTKLCTLWHEKTTEYSFLILRFTATLFYDLPDTRRLGDLRLSIYASPAIGVRGDCSPLGSLAATSELSSIANCNHKNGYNAY